MTDTAESESAVFSLPVLHGEGPGVGLSVGVSEIAEVASAPPPTPSPQAAGIGIGELRAGRPSRAATEIVA